jgi:predicted transcriptional regulator
MPYRDPELQRDYLRRYHDARRPKPEPQPDPKLPPAGVIRTSADFQRIQCHVCGRWLGALPFHIARLHGLRAAEYKDIYGLARGASLTSPHWQERQRQRALERDLGRRGVPFLPKASRPAGVPNRLQSRLRSSDGKRGQAPKGRRRRKT